MGRDSDRQILFLDSGRSVEMDVVGSERRRPMVYLYIGSRITLASVANSVPQMNTTKKGRFCPEGGFRIGHGRLD